MAQSFLIVGLLVQKHSKRSAEESLRQKTEELDQFFNVLLDPLCIANTDGYFLRLNPAWEMILGYSREMLMTQKFLDFVHPDDLAMTQEAISTESGTCRNRLEALRKKRRRGTSLSGSVMII